MINPHRSLAHPRRAAVAALPLAVFALLSIIFLALATSTDPPAKQPDAGPDFRHVIIISIDGLRPDAIQAAGPENTPALHELLHGPHTLNARTDPNYTVTLPNHTDMITGRLTSGDQGHNWTGNLDPSPDATLHTTHGSYVASIFDVAHDHGVHTALLAGKTKFSLWKNSYDARNGAQDTTGPDNGPDKIDHFLIARADRIADDAVAYLKSNARQSTLVFIHLAETDFVGHGRGWHLEAGSPYLQTVANIDHVLSRIVEVVKTQPGLAGHTAIILTADHGGGMPLNNHVDKDDPLNYVIPFIVWLGENRQSVDLYALNHETRVDPGQQQLQSDAPRQPIRNADAANLALGLLDLPPVPGSTVNPLQDLRVTE